MSGANPRRILLFGPRGQVGWELRRTLAPLGQVITAGREGAEHPADLADPATAAAAVAEVGPDLVVNAAAYTAVDAAEDEPDLARRINADAPAEMAAAAAERGTPLVHFSTDYVFDGAKADAYTESDETRPMSVYGVTKRDGERAVAAAGGPHLVLRTSWVYGLRGKNFLRTMLRLAAERDHLDVVDDQIGAPTWSRWIAEMTAQMLGQLGGDAADWQRRGGVIHLTAGGQTSWYGFLQRILALAEPPEGWRVQSVAPIATEQFPTKAERPRNSVLAGQRLAAEFGLHRLPWDEALALCLAQRAE